MIQDRAPKTLIACVVATDDEESLVGTLEEDTHRLFFRGDHAHWIST